MESTLIWIGLGLKSLFILNILFFESRLRFTARLRGRYRFPIYPPPLSTFPTRVFHLLELMNLHWYIIITQKTIVYIRVHSWCTFYRFGHMCQNVLIIISILQGIFTKFSVLCQFFFSPLSPSLNPWQPLIFLLSA